MSHEPCWDLFASRAPRALQVPGSVSGVPAMSRARGWHRACRFSTRDAGSGAERADRDSPLVRERQALDVDRRHRPALRLGGSLVPIRLGSGRGPQAAARARAGLTGQKLSVRLSAFAGRGSGIARVPGLNRPEIKQIGAPKAGARVALSKGWGATDMNRRRFWLLTVALLLPEGWLTPALARVRVPPRRRGRGARRRYSTGPMIQGANSSSPTPERSLFVRLPEATAMISSKICRPTTSSGVPSRITPQLMSMSSSMCR